MKEICDKCNGTGKIDRSRGECLKQEIEKASSIAVEEYKEKQMIPILKMLKNPIYMGDNLVCSFCDTEINPGNCGFICIICGNLPFCTDCQNYRNLL